ncbi:hypothetical protein P0D69_43910 [Paraburkholderia sediminicola]|uniref:hypothetical protein n=1 Tax=Paraburkholderia sediminicola TaxID=458836 RepID=UPI0038BDC293
MRREAGLRWSVRDPQRVVPGAEPVVIIDRVPQGLAMARAAGAITINFEDENVVKRLNELT